jgi:hypothetical protein
MVSEGLIMAKSATASPTFRFVPFESDVNVFALFKNDTPLTIAAILRCYNHDISCFCEYRLLAP